jgi:hypothetical protein
MQVLYMQHHEVKWLNSLLIYFIILFILLNVHNIAAEGMNVEIPPKKPKYSITIPTIDRTSATMNLFIHNCFKFIVIFFFAQPCI